MRRSSSLGVVETKSVGLIARTLSIGPEEGVYMCDYCYKFAQVRGEAGRRWLRELMLYALPYEGASFAYIFSLCNEDNTPYFFVTTFFGIRVLYSIKKYK